MKPIGLARAVASRTFVACPSARRLRQYPRPPDEAQAGLPRHRTTVLMALHCPRCERKLADTADPSEPPLFCMCCGQKLRTGDEDITLPPVVMPDPPSVAVADEDAATTRSAGSPSAATAVETETAPTRVAGFRLMRFLGAGGMGT